MTVDNILIKATRKLIHLNEIADWNNELLSKSPPVLWFGNSKSPKDKVLTIGANPSRWEFLDQSQIKTCSVPYHKACYETKYLSKQRFLHLSSTQTYSDILLSKSLRNEIVDSYDNYFKKYPYKWFGSDKIDSYFVEGLLRGLSASYFEIESEFRACHIDIFPFATISDFNKIQSITKRDILSELWAKNLVDELLNYFNPKLILIFGVSNFNYISKYFNIHKAKGVKWQAKEGKGNCDYWHTQYGNYRIIAVSVNLGNPRSFNVGGLNELGEHLRMQFNL